MRCQNNLKSIALALREYNELHGQLPPAYTRDANGQPAHSWRIFILPQLGEEALFASYRFDEPWNGPNNRLLADQMPSVFRCDGYHHHLEHLDAEFEGDDLFTPYVVPAGPDTLLRPDESISLDSLDTVEGDWILVAEMVGNGRHWMSPENVSPQVFAQTVSGAEDEDFHHPSGIVTARTNGSVQFLTGADQDIQSIENRCRVPLPTTP